MRTRLLGLLLAATAAAPAAGQPVTGTCTVTSVAVIARSIGLTFPVAGAVGFAFPVTIDPAAGSIALDRTGWTAVPFTTLGIAAALDLDRTVVTGTIDAAGNVALPGFGSTFTTSFCMPPCNLIVNTTLASGFQQVEFAGAIYPTRGTALDFTTGLLTLEGHVGLPEAPGGGSTSGLRLTCAMSPLPDAGALPAAATLTRAQGRVKIGPPLPTSPPAAGDVPGDSLVLEARLAPGARALDPARDLFITLGTGSGATGEATLLVRGGTLQGKRTLKATDEGGTSIVVLSGRKETEIAGVGPIRATLRGTLRVKNSRKALTLKLVHEGLDLGALAGGPAGTVRVQVGDEAGTRGVTTKTTRKATKFR